MCGLKELFYCKNPEDNREQNQRLAGKYRYIFGS